ncbi:hypothetical protein [Microvirga sp. 17 mud 1-3]|uniref:hypothetical protein n=1 Tax=Microvirga sp. 17 mud 1-3 TaxID=2082949 RepID=UPI000D6B8A48|nr:hypothetical protein [Microvirga sp. 17 mud 1-3]AWM86225.1 hypothetical protein C4E04_05370 [Microvirga sp. 17 mud 1-3]
MNFSTVSTAPRLFLAGLFALLAIVPARAEDTASPSWAEVKCIRYGKAWGEAIARQGSKGLGRDFLANHEAFLASGCTERPEVCPRSAEELDLANMMVVAAMNAGTASTFPPFRCNR